MDLVDTEFIEESNSISNSEEEIQFSDLGECEIIDEIDFMELELIPHAMVKEGQTLEGFICQKKR